MQHAAIYHIPQRTQQYAHRSSTSIHPPPFDFFSSQNYLGAINHSFKKANPDAPCLIFRDTVKTYSEVAAEISALGAALVNDFSIKLVLKKRIYHFSITNYQEELLAVRTLSMHLIRLFHFHGILEGRENADTISGFAVGHNLI